MRARLRPGLAGPCLAAALSLLAGTAHAGAWPRGAGEAFLSVRADLERARRGPAVSTSLYGEYGLGDRWTLVGAFSTADDPSTPSRAGVAVEYALTGPDAVNRIAVGFGVSSPPDAMGLLTASRLESSLHWGRGFESRYGDGWATLSARLIYARDQRRPITDLYGLIGLRPAEGWMTMLSASRFEDAGGVYWKLSPSVGYEVRKRLWIVPNLTQELTNDASLGVGVAVWFSF